MTSSTGIETSPAPAPSNSTKTATNRPDPSEGGEDPGPSHSESEIPYGDMHRLVLQGIMSAGILDAKGVKKLFVAACSYLNFRGEEVEQRTSMEFIQQVVRNINEKIKPFDMMIRSASCELTGKKFYIFLLTVEKQLLKLQTVFSKFEIALFRKIMDTMLRKYPTYSVPPSECLNLALQIETKPSGGPGPLSVAETFIEKMLEQHYFIKFPTMDPDDFHYTLGVRALRELETIMNDHYFDVITKCTLCKMVLLHGILCYQCKLVMHKTCYTRYIKTSSICPQCKVTWTKSKMIMRTRNEENTDFELDPSKVGAAGTSEERTDPANETLIDQPTTASSAAAISGGPEDTEMPILSPMEIDALGLGNIGSEQKNNQSPGTIE